MEPQVQTATSIMVVEDEPVTLQMITAILDKEGYAVHCVTDGLQCLKSVARIQPDVILMDVVMPRLNGIDTCRRLKADPNLNQIPVVFITGNDNDHILESAFKSGASDFIRKPLNRVELLSRINLVINLQQTIQKRAEAEKLKGVLETAGGVCHTLNQPLQYVLGAVQILLMDIPPDDKMYTILDTIREKVEQMGSITRKLAEVTRYRTKAHAGGKRILDLDQCTDKIEY